jgi:transcriptional regulator with XRE-family HTH domain
MVKDLGLVILKHRNMKNLSQEKLADLIGVSRQAIVNWEENKSTPSLINFAKISEELDIPMAVISDSKKQLEIVSEVNLDGGLIAILAREKNELYL